MKLADDAAIQAYMERLADDLPPKCCVVVVVARQDDDGVSVLSGGVGLSKEGSIKLIRELLGSLERESS